MIRDFEAQRQAASAARAGEGNGVAMPGPMSGGFEAGFDAVGENFSGIDHTPVPTEQGPSLPGWPPHEIGWDYGQDVRNMEDADPIPQGMDMGTHSNGSDIFAESISHGDDPRGAQESMAPDAMRGLWGGQAPFVVPVSGGELDDRGAAGHTADIPHRAFSDGVVSSPSGIDR